MLETFRPAPLWRHVLAMLYDSLLVVALVAVVNTVALGVVVAVSSGRQEVLNPHLVQALTALTITGFFCLFWCKNGQTLGMQAWRIKLVSLDGQTPTLGRALLRCVGAALSMVCLGLGYLWRLVDRDQRTWHDRLSRTQLILLPHEQRGAQP